MIDVGFPDGTSGKKKKKKNNLENPMDRGALEGYSPWGRKE